MGLSLDEVIAAATSRPAEILGLKDLGTLCVGAIADVAIFEMQTGNFDFVDSYGNHMNGGQRLVNTLTIKDGQIWARS